MPSRFSEPPVSTQESSPLLSAAFLALSACGSTGQSGADAGTTTSPKYAMGSTVTVLADHMPGMKGATGTVVGVYDTQTYAVSYTSQTDGTKMSNHKWVTESELAAK